VQPSDAWIEDWLSAGRFATYLTVLGGSRKRSLDLYEWNARRKPAFLHDLSHLEVGLRNLGDRQPSAAVVAADTHWTNPSTLLMLFPVASRRDRVSGRQYHSNAILGSNVERASKKATTARYTPPVPGKTIAEIMFGLWTYLFSDLHEKTIWVPYRHKAFPPGTDRNQLNATLAS